MIVTNQVEDFYLQAECDADLETQARALLGALTEMHKGGPSLKSGSVVHYGWVDLRLEICDAEATVLRVCEPDFVGAGIEHTIPRVDYTLRVLEEQARLLRTLGCSGEQTTCTDSVVVARDCLLEPRIYLERRAAVGRRDSGWYIGPVESSNGNELESVPAYRLLSLRPEVMPVLSLPRGYIATFDGERLEAILDDQDRRLWPVRNEVAR